MISRKKIFVVAATLVLLIGLRLSLPFLAKYYINRQLNRDPVYHGSIEGVRIHLWKGAYTILDLNIERVVGQKTFPLIACEKIQIGLSWRELLHRAIAARIEAENFEINFVQEPLPKNGKSKTEKKVAVGADSSEGKKKEADTWQSIFNNLVPLDVGRLTLSQGKIHFRDLTSKPEVDVYLDQVRVEGENLTNSTRLSKSLFGTIQINARAMKSGKLDMNLYINPLSIPLQFKLETQLSELDLVNLNQFFMAYGKFDVKHGKFSLYSEMATANNKIEGYFKPLVKDLQVTDFSRDQKKGLPYAVWEQIVGAVGAIFKNHSQDQQAAKIPFSGRVDKIDVDLWGTFTSVLENLFVKPILPKLENSVNLKDLKKASKK